MISSEAALTTTDIGGRRVAFMTENSMKTIPQWESALAVGGQLLFIHFISYFPSKYQFPPSLTGILRLY